MNKRKNAKNKSKGLNSKRDYQRIRMDKNLKISEEAHKLLCDYGKKGETFDDIIKRLVRNSKV